MQKDDTFIKLMQPADGKPLAELGSVLIVHWYNSDNYKRFLNQRTPANLNALFSASLPENLKSLTFDKTSKIPFSGEWFINMSIGKNVSIREEAKFMCHGGLALGDRAIIGKKSIFVAVSHPPHPTQRHLIINGPIEVGADALIGAESVVINKGSALPVRIGEKSITLPKTIIVKNIPPYAVVGGVSKTLLQGERYFKKGVVQGASLADRLTEEGLMQLGRQGVFRNYPSLMVETDISNLSIPINFKADNVFGFEEAASAATRNAFFKNSDPDALDSVFLLPPISFSGQIPAVPKGCIINSGAVMASHETGPITLSEGVFIAPRVQVLANEKAAIKLEPNVWLGADVIVRALPQKPVVIGHGSILAAGAVVTASVPPMSVVIGEGKILRQITEKDIFDLPYPLNDQDTLRQLRSEAAREVAALSYEDKTFLARQLLIMANRAPRTFDLH